MLLTEGGKNFSESTSNLQNILVKLINNMYTDDHSSFVINFRKRKTLTNNFYLVKNGQSVEIFPLVTFSDPV